MNRLVTKLAPDFTAKAVFPDDTIRDVTLSSFRGKYVYLLFYPMDFTFVCPSELIAFHKKFEEFQERRCQVLGISTDSEYTHLAWRNTPTEKGGLGQISFPLVADITKQISREYHLLVDEAVALRGLFLIDQKGVVRHELVNDLSLGRSVDEALRMLDALQFTEEHGEVCPADWQKGQEGMVPTTEGVANYLKHQKR